MSKIDLVFLLPGNPSSGIQAINTQMAISSLMSKGKSVAIQHSISNNIYLVRNGCLGSNKMDKGQKPFGGKDYGHLVWVDSDNFISPEIIERLISHNVDVVGAWYGQKAGPITEDSMVTCGEVDIEYFKEEHKQLIIQPLKSYNLRHYNAEDIRLLPRNGKGLLEVGYLGLGCVVMKKGIMESLDFPWFKSWVLEYEKEGKIVRELVTDDLGICLRLRDKGFNLFIDPEVRVGHEKSFIG
jgi:hypothetical protein